MIRLNRLKGRGLVLISLLFCLILSVSLYSIFGLVEATDSIIIDARGVKVDTLHNSLQIAGRTVDDSKVFVGYKYRVKEDQIFIKLSYVLAIKKGSHHFKIRIKDNLSEINKIYLQGSLEKDKRLLWERSVSRKD